MTSQPSTIAAETERSVIAALLRDYNSAVSAEPELRDPAASRLFGLPANVALYGWLTRQSAAGCDLSLATVTRRLMEEQPGLLAEFGGSGTLTTAVFQQAAVPALLPDAVSRLKAAERKRRALRLMQELQEQLTSLPTGDGESLSEWMQRLRDGSDALHGDGKAIPDWEAWVDVLRETIEDIHKRAQDGDQDAVGVTGLEALDRRLGGLRRGNLYVIGGRTSTGKTAMAIQWARESARRGCRVAYFNLEMKNKQILIRCLASESGVDAQIIGEQVLRPEEVARVIHAAGQIQDWPIWLIHRSRIKLEGLLTELRHLHRRVGVDMIVVDYLQRIRFSQGSARIQSEMRLQVAECIGELKGLSDELNIPVVVLSQLRREAEDAGTKRLPRLSDLSESSSIENDSDAVVLLHRAGREDPKVDIILAKARNAGIGKIEGLFDGATHTFTQNYNIEGFPQQTVHAGRIGALLATSGALKE